MTNSPNLQLPYIAAAQAQKHLTHNEAIRALDGLVQLSVADRNRTSPPASPANGVRYLVPAGATGAWAGQSGTVAAFQDDAWSFFMPREGWVAWIADEDVLLAYDGTQWTDTAGVRLLLGVNTTADLTNRLAVKSEAVLFSHDDVTPGSGDLRQVLNKSAAARTVSQLYQSNYSGRAETGLTGDDNFHVKVSPDGTAWQEAILIDRSTGVVSLPQSAAISGANKLLLLDANGRISRFVTGIAYQPQVAIADDAVFVWNPQAGALFGGIMQFKFTSTSLPYGSLWVRAASGPQTIGLSLGGTPLGLYTTALTGTTGTDGQVNIGADTAGNIYIENRRGFAGSFSATIFS